VADCILHVCLTLVGVSRRKENRKRNKSIGGRPLYPRFYVDRTNECGRTKRTREEIASNEKRERITHGVRSRARYKFTSIYFLSLHPLVISSLL
jgi:hypothetical protein